MTTNAARRLTGLCAAALMLLSGCSRTRAPVVASAPPLPTAITAPAQTLPTVAQEELIHLGQFNDFALKLFQRQSGNDNWVVSPANIALSLGQLRPGAEGETAAQLDSCLGLEDEYTDDQAWASVVNLRSELEALAPGSLWQGWGLMMGEGPSVKVQYTNLLSQSLGSGVELVDYENDDYKDTYTAWFKQASGGLITKFPMIPETNVPLAVVSAAALDGKWAKAFNPENIRNASFAMENGQKVSVAMMTSKASPAILADDTVTFAAVPMEGDLEAWMILPAEGVLLKDFVQGLTLEQLGQWREQAVVERCLINVPKVDITTNLELISTLEDMGFAAPADSESADFSDMGANISVGSVLTACRLRLGENGTAAADEPMSQRMLRGMDRELKSYSFARPYVLAVVHEDTGSLLMLAGVARPAAAES